MALISYNYQTSEIEDYYSGQNQVQLWVESLEAKILAKLHMTHIEAQKAGRSVTHGENGYWSVSEWPELISS
jgi:antirestriction protein ArdC